MKKKILSLILIISIISAFSFALVACDKQEDEKQLSIVYIGDSIAEAVIGPSPICEREYYGYHAIVGKRNNYKYYNRSVSGHLTDDLLKLLYNDKDENAKMFLSTIKSSDIIQISILGNNFLQRDLDTMTLEMAELEKNKAENPNEQIDDETASIKEILYGNNKDISSAIYDFGSIIEKLKELNPKATILVQTIYNPLYFDSDLVTDQTKQILMNDYGMNESQTREFSQKMLDKLNGIIFDYKEAHPDDFEILKINAEFNRINDENEDRGKRLIFNDWVHPSNEGHAVIADVTQAKLEELGLADHDKALKNYKELRIEQLKRLFSKSNLNIKSISKQINKAKSCSQVTAIYFSAIQGQMPSYC